MTDAWLDRRGVADYLHVSIDRVRRLDHAGKLGRRSDELGPHSPRWSRAAIDAMMQGRPAPKPKRTAREIGAEITADILKGRV